MIKAIVFDFDGVIVRNSEFSKESAWLNIFPREHEREILKARQKFVGGKGSRLEIIRELAPLFNIPEEKVDRWIDRWIQDKAEEYARITSLATIQEGVLAEDFGALHELSMKYRLYLNSATPESVLPDIVKQLGIIQFFKALYGWRNPDSKLENLKRVLKDENISRENILFVGDADSDYEAAKEFECSFVGIMNDWNKWKKNSKPFDLISGAKDLLNYCP